MSFLDNLELSISRTFNTMATNFENNLGRSFTGSLSNIFRSAVEGFTGDRTLGNDAAHIGRNTAGNILNDRDRPVYNQRRMDNTVGNVIQRGLNSIFGGPRRRF